MFDLTQLHGIGDFTTMKRGEDTLYSVPAGKAFLVLRPKTLEVRSDQKLSRVLREKYETVMESRYFGRGGIEIVPSGQLTPAELEDLIRLSYNLTVEEHNAENKISQ